jgi:hypothetical protein
MHLWCTTKMQPQRTFISTHGPLGVQRFGDGIPHQ